MPNRNVPSIDGVSERTEGNWRVFSVADPNSLTQLVGWLKFTAESGLVLYRGQQRLHNTMMATGFRDGGPRMHEQLNREMREHVSKLTGADCSCPSGPYSFGQAHLCRERVQRTTTPSRFVLSSTYRAVVEPLLQHYGLRTRWLDVVDNVWIALWFACHAQESEGRYAHHLRRSIAREGTDAKAYIVVFDTGPLVSTEIPGYSVGSHTRVVDLRYCVPSTYLRPHAQHGVLLAPAKIPDGVTPSLDAQVPCAIEVPLIDALDWLGAGVMTSAFALFPPATRDIGYRRLLEPGVPVSKLLGEITVFGPSG